MLSALLTAITTSHQSPLPAEWPLDQLRLCKPLTLKQT
jgi:hypothetical protein